MGIKNKEHLPPGVKRAVGPEVFIFLAVFFLFFFFIGWKMGMTNMLNTMMNTAYEPVSYTHLDVYKRQDQTARRSPAAR